MTVTRTKAVNYTPNWDLTTIPDDLLARERNRRLSLRRDPANAGRKKVLHPCPHCREPFGVRELRKHRPLCPSRE